MFDLMTKVEEVGVKVLKCECKILCFLTILPLGKKENQNTHTPYFSFNLRYRGVLSTFSTFLRQQHIVSGRN